MNLGYFEQKETRRSCRKNVVLDYFSITFVSDYPRIRRFRIFLKSWNVRKVFEKGLLRNLEKKTSNTIITSDI